MNKPINEIDLSYASIVYVKPIVYYTYKEDAELGFPEIRELIAWAEKLSEYNSYVTFADARVNMSITNEGKRFLTNLENMPLFRGTAAWVDNSIYKHAANFLNYYNRPKYPFRAFTSKGEAINWLLSLPLD
ncbi:MAG TPA: hypothetical protein VKG26_07675 [Bacteroidia bacterium]|nr:hypothetical protein [Bacteroidia bacterium]